MAVRFDDYCYANDTDLIDALQARVDTKQISGSLFVPQWYDDGNSTNRLVVPNAWRYDVATNAWINSADLGVSFPSCTTVGPFSLGHGWDDLSVSVPFVSAHLLEGVALLALAWCLKQGRRFKARG